MAEVLAPSQRDLLSRLVVERRSIRKFANEPVPREAVEDLLRDILWAPSPHNSQPWRFTVLFAPQDKSSLARAMAERLEGELHADGLDPSAIEEQTSRSRRRISTAPVVIVCSLTQDGLVSYPDARRNSLEWQMAVQSVGAVLQTLFLLAHARGFGTCWMAAPMYCAEVVRNILRLHDDYHPQALVLMGYPVTPGKVRPRRAFHEVVDFR